MQNAKGPIKGCTVAVIGKYWRTSFVDLFPTRKILIVSMSVKHHKNTKKAMSIHGLICRVSTCLFLFNREKVSRINSERERPRDVNWLVSLTCAKLHGPSFLPNLPIPSVYAKEGF